MARATGDVVGFRRIFILFCTLVLLPAMLLSGFGIVAIRNEATAAKQRQRERAERILDDVERDLARRIQRLDEALASASDDALPGLARALRENGELIGETFMLEASGELRFVEPASAPGLVDDEIVARARRVSASLAPKGVGHIAVLSGDGARVLAVSRRESGRVFCYVVDEERLVAALPAVDAEDVKVSLVRESERDPMIVAEEWMRTLVESGRAPDTRRDEIARRTLPAPFDRLSLVATGPAPSTTVSVVYIVLLVVFYGILITGVVITSRLIWQETRISRLKTDFVSHVSHELRTPLTSIRMFIETLRLGRAQSPEEQAECLDLLGQETERLSEMIERVLGYARLESGRRTFHREVVPAREVVDDAVKAFRAHTLADVQAKTALTVDVANETPLVDVDREALTEALLNLIGNAYKYTGADKRIRVFIEGKKGRVAIGVEDNGPGIPKAEWRRIFDRFYQSGHLLSREKGGSGLGLAIARRIVEGHKGKITVSSAPGAGSTFVIELPIAKSPQPTPRV